jgi:hypothetical protein
MVRSSPALHFHSRRGRMDRMRRSADCGLSLAKIAICVQIKQMKVHSTWLESR